MALAAVALLAAAGPVLAQGFGGYGYGYGDGDGGYRRPPQYDGDYGYRRPPPPPRYDAYRGQPDGYGQPMLCRTEEGSCRTRGPQSYRARCLCDFGDGAVPGRVKP